MIEWLIKIFLISKNDPLYNCLLYKRHGCSHVDGLLCDFPNCSMSKKYDLQEMEQQLDIPYNLRIK